MKTYDVTMRFQFPAWDEKEGITYYDIRAASKSQAIKYARSRGFDDGHTGQGKGRTTFTAKEQHTN